MLNVDFQVDYAAATEPTINGVAVPDGAVYVLINGAKREIEFFDCGGGSLGVFAFSDNDAPAP